MKQEQPEDAGNGRGYGIGPDEQGSGKSRAAQGPVGHGSQKQTADDGNRGHRSAENKGCDDRFQVEGVGKKGDKVVEPDKFSMKTKRIAQPKGGKDSLYRRPVKKGQGNQNLREDQQIG